MRPRTTLVTTRLRIRSTRNGNSGLGWINSTVTNTETVHVSAGSYFDVVFNGAGNIPLDQTTIDGNEISISGSGVGAGLQLTGTPTVLADGRTVRYYVSGGVWQAGTVTVTFNAGSWADTAGDLGSAGSKSFSLIQPIQASVDADQVVFGMSG